MTGRSHPAFLPTSGIHRLGVPCFSEAPGYIHHNSMPLHRLCLFLLRHDARPQPPLQLKRLSHRLPDWL